MQVFEQFDRIYCLNLEHRTDRRESAQKQFDEHGLSKVEFVNAIDGAKNEFKSIYKQITPGAMGAYRSHLMLVKKAYDSGAESVFIFEDDFRFEPGFKDFFAYQMHQLPNDWNFLYAGWADFKGFEAAASRKVNDWVCIPEEPYGLFAYAVRGRSFMMELIDFWERRMDLMQKQVDEYLCFELWPHSSAKMYALIPPLIWYNDMGTNIQTNKGYDTN